MTRTDYHRCKLLGRDKLPPELRAEFDAKERLYRLLVGVPERNGVGWIEEVLG